MGEQTVPKLTLRGAVDARLSRPQLGGKARAPRVSCAERERGWVGRAPNAEVHDAKGKAAALAWVRVFPEIEPFFRGPGFVIRAQCLVADWPGNCGLVVAGSPTAGAGHGLRRLGVGCEDADCSASSTGRALRKTWGLLGCVNADGSHVVVLGALSTSAITIWLRRSPLRQKAPPKQG